MSFQVNVASKSEAKLATFLGSSWHPAGKRFFRDRCSDRVNGLRTSRSRLPSAGTSNVNTMALHPAASARLTSEALTSRSFNSSPTPMELAPGRTKVDANEKFY
jgi:hypothetical protein